MACVSRKFFPASPNPSSDAFVLDDLAGMPVSDTELDAIDAFLMAAFRDLVAKDCEPGQSHAETEDIPEGRRTGL